MCMEKTTGTRTGRKPKNDPADHKYSFRLNAEENTRFEKLLADSGAGNLTPVSYTHLTLPTKA